MSDDQFSEAVTDAKAEGNLSRANVVRKVRKQSGPSTRDARTDLIADLAAQGYSSRQMPERVGVIEGTVRRTARDHDITIPADKVIGHTKRIDSNRVAREIVTGLKGHSRRRAARLPRAVRSQSADSPQEVRKPSTLSNTCQRHHRRSGAWSLAPAQVSDRREQFPAYWPAHPPPLRCGLR